MRYILTHRHTRLSDVQKAEICRRYASGENTYVLATAFGVHNDHIGTILNQHGIKRRSASEAHRAYSCDHSFFDSIDTEAKAYWLGFMAADGSVASREQRLKVALAAKDRSHLLKFKVALQSNHPVSDYITRSGHHGSVLAVTSPQLVAGLAIHGVNPCKSFTLEWPATLPSADMLRHYLRGYFDGDGGFALTGPEGKSAKLHFQLTSNEAFCLGAQAHLMQSVGVKKTKLYAPAASPNIRRLNYCGTRQVIRIARHLYQGARIYLPRKHAQVARLL